MKTTTLDHTKYGKLLAKTRPRVIHNDAELEHFTRVLLELDELESPSIEEQEVAELLTTLIEQYESELYQLPKATPIELIQFLLEQQGKTAKDLWPILGSKGNTSEVLNGKRNIGFTTAAKLGGFFKVAPELFVEWKPVTVLPNCDGKNNGAVDRD